VVRFGDLEGWTDADPIKGLEAFRRSCIAILDKAADAPLGGLGYAGRVTDWEEACHAAMAIQPSTPDTARRFFEANFVPYQVAQQNSDGLFTGYYEPELRGSRTRHGAFQTPLYAIPVDLVRRDMGVFRDTYFGRMINSMMAMGMGMMMRFVPYPARADIERDGIPAAPILYVDNPVDAFFLQIQGSGRVILDDGTVVRAAYAGQNGQPYTAIGAVLIQRGWMTREELSAQSIRDWLVTHPEQAQEIMNTNASYVFFAEKPIGDPNLGAVGAQGVPLTPEASLAVDRSIHALGVPIWLESTAPTADSDIEERPFDALVVAQDTGGAIKGVIRGDVYWGYGNTAGIVAGKMKYPGRMNLLLPRELAAKLGRHAEFALP
jgi:membrane-bound lytic murein transglycosylase A